MTEGKEEAEVAKDILRTFIDWKQITGFFLFCFVLFCCFFFFLLHIT